MHTEQAVHIQFGLNWGLHCPTLSTPMHSDLYKASANLIK